MKNADTKIGKLKKKMDTMFSLIVRSHGECEMCSSKKNLQCAHIVSRRNIKTRWDLENAVCLCMRCHLYVAHKEPHEFVRWFDGKYGPRLYDKLKKRANKGGRFDYEAKYNELLSLYERVK
jgi:5-methylcytosine-specific restriction endonuclease McrA